MKKKLLDLLVCPETKSQVTLIDADFDDWGNVRTGKLVSEKGRVYPIREYIPRFVDTDTYVASFSKQRKHLMKRFEEWKKDNKDRPVLFAESTGFRLKNVSGSNSHKSLFLDVGCGYGRFSKTIVDSGNEVVSVDMSTTSIELAQKYIGANDNAHLVQCDLAKLPFKQESFDYIFAIGVLHHTPDAQSAFASVVPYLKRGGQIAIWVYSPEAKRWDNKIRRITTRLPNSIVFYLCLPMPFVYEFYRWIRGIPSAKYGYWPTVLGIFDSWTPTYASVHEPEEVVRWFESNGLCEIQALDRRTAVCGVKP